MSLGLLCPNVGFLMFSACNFSVQQLRRTLPHMGSKTLSPGCSSAHRAMAQALDHLGSGRRVKLCETDEGTFPETHSPYERYFTVFQYFQRYCISHYFSMKKLAIELLLMESLCNPVRRTSTQLRSSPRVRPCQSSTALQRVSWSSGPWMDDGPIDLHIYMYINRYTEKYIELYRYLPYLCNYSIVYPYIIIYPSLSIYISLSCGTRTQKVHQTWSSGACPPLRHVHPWYIIPSVLIMIPIVENTPKLNLRTRVSR
jgi:hypothetical protein